MMSTTNGIFGSIPTTSPSNFGTTPTTSSSSSGSTSTTSSSAFRMTFTTLPSNLGTTIAASFGIGITTTSPSSSGSTTFSPHSFFAVPRTVPGSTSTTESIFKPTSSTTFSFGSTPTTSASVRASSEALHNEGNSSKASSCSSQVPKTIHLKFDSKDKLPVLSTGSNGEIKKRRDLVSFEWTVPDFLSGNGFTFLSPDFRFLDCSWYLKLIPFLKNNGEQWHSIYLFSKDMTDEISKKDMAVHFAVQQCGEWRFNCKETIIFLSGNTVCCGKQEFLSQAIVTERKSDFLKSGALTIACSIKERMIDSPKVKCLEILSSELKDLFLNKTQSDVTIKVKDAEFQAHKAILVARSSVFASTFEHDMREKETGVINIEDCDSSSFGDFLKYLYIGEIGDISLKSACSLYVTADKYNVQELKSCCVGFMKRDLAVENVCTVIALADQFEETSLLADAETYFCRNYSEVLSTAEWELLLKTNYRLANKVLKKVVSRDESSKGMFSFGGFGKYPMF